MSQIVYKIIDVHKLLEELQEGFITNDPVPLLTYEEQETVSRNLYGDYRHNIYCLEPNNSYYKINLEKETTDDSIEFFKFNNLLTYGLSYNLVDDTCLYICNLSENNVYIDSKTRFIKEE